MLWLMAMVSSWRWDNAILTSADGINWFQRQFVNGWYSLTGITYANGQFVAVGDNSTIATSADGVNWVSRPSGSAGDLPRVAYGDGQFVTPVFVPGHSTVLTSTDGVSWVQRWSDAQNQYSQPIGVGYGNGLWVVVGATQDSTTRQSQLLILTSADGANWVQRRSDAHAVNSFLSDVAYGNGQFVAVGDTGMILTSADGVTWVQRRMGTQDQLNGLAYGKGQFVAVGGRFTDPLLSFSLQENAILTSIDALNWVRRDPGTTNVLFGIAYGNGRFVTVGNPHYNSATDTREDTILTSADGVNWIKGQVETNQPPSSLFDVAYGNGQFVAVGDAGTILLGPSIQRSTTTHFTIFAPELVSMKL